MVKNALQRIMEISSETKCRTHVANRLVYAIESVCGTKLGTHLENRSDMYALYT